MALDIFVFCILIGDLKANSVQSYYKSWVIVSVKIMDSPPGMLSYVGYLWRCGVISDSSRC